MAERDVIKDVLKLLRDEGAFAEKIHGSQFQPALVDIIACYRGVFIGLECKAKEGMVPTDRQLYTLEQIAKAGGRTAVVYDASQVLAILRKIDAALDRSSNGGKGLSRNRANSE